MSVGEVAAIIAAVAVGLGVVGVLIGLGSVMKTMASVRHAVEDLHRQAVPLLADMHAAVRQTTSELERVDDVLDTTQSISRTVDSASRLAYRAVSNPVVKAMAFASGSTRAFRSLRRKA